MLETIHIVAIMNDMRYLLPLPLPLLLASCSLEEPNPHYLGKCQDPVIAEFSEQTGHDPCPQAMVDWSIQDKTGACYYRSICGPIYQIGGCYLAPSRYCKQGVEDLGKQALIEVVAGK